MSRPPMNLIFPERTAAGISKNQDGQRVIAATRRPDGTFRQEIKIRPGFTPQEDVSRFRSQKQVELDHHRQTKGTVPGLNPLVGAALAGIAGAGASKSAKKNARRKDKRHDDAAAAAAAAAAEVKDSWDDEDDNDNVTLPTKTPEPSSPRNETTTTTTTTEEERAKRLRNLRKKLKQTVQLQEKRDGGATLEPAEQDKVDGIRALEDEIAKLELA
ncbi:hypothetical protein JCM11491_004428 [Sporobolomyces phaffii]